MNLATQICEFMRRQLADTNIVIFRHVLSVTKL